MTRLEQLLGRSRQDINRLAAEAPRLYRPFDTRHVGSTKAWRHIDNPQGELKEVQKLIQKRILEPYSFPPNMLGGVRGKTILQNAQIHLARECLWTIDLRSCFPRTHDLRVFEAFKSKLGCSPEIAGILTKLTTLQHRLPQGAPTSTLLANLTLIDLYFDIERIAKRYNLAMSFWVDDIALSGSRRIHSAMDPAIRAVMRHGHSVSRRKVKLMPNSAAQALTGIGVNNAPSIGRARIDKIVDLIYEIGLRDNLVFADELRSIRGKSQFAKQINPSQASMLKRLQNRLLPADGEERGKRQKDERRECKRTRRHRCRFK